jgi:Protein of unknown function (DUF4007)
MKKLSFSGHESFTCRQFWLKKAYDYSTLSKSFNDNQAVLELGVGKNMVTAIRYWAKSFGIIDSSDKPTDFAELLFGENGKDIYLEDIGTLWLLHYQVIKKNYSTIYNKVFNTFRKERIYFTKEQLYLFLKNEIIKNEQGVVKEKTLRTDINVFLKNYVKPEHSGKFEFEDDFMSVLIDLDLIKIYKQYIENKTIEHYKIESEKRDDLPYQIVLFSILDNYKNQNSISFKELQVGHNSPGLVFAINADGLYQKIIQMTENFSEIVFSETAGNQTLQIKETINPQDVLDDYYKQ